MVSEQARQLHPPHTVGCCVENDEAGIDRCLKTVMFPIHCVGMAAQPIRCLEHMDFMTCIAKSPECADAGDTAADDCYAFSFHPCRIYPKITLEWRLYRHTKVKVQVKWQDASGSQGRRLASKNASVDVIDSRTNFVSASIRPNSIRLTVLKRNSTPPSFDRRETSKMPYICAHADADVAEVSPFQHVARTVYWV
jgi:hypothetical protein